VCWVWIPGSRCRCTKTVAAKDASKECGFGLDRLTAVMLNRYKTSSARLPYADTLKCLINNHPLVQNHLAYN
jgi:hypothetical protein